MHFDRSVRHRIQSAVISHHRCVRAEASRRERRGWRQQWWRGTAAAGVATTARRGFALGGRMQNGTGYGGVREYGGL